MHSYHALTHVCVGSCMCCAQATSLSKLQLAQGPFIPYFCVAITRGQGVCVCGHDKSVCVCVWA